MATETYNLGRVVGWSTYEQFLLENPNIDPTVITQQVYQTMVTYGVTRRVTLPTTGWTGDTILHQTIRVYGAEYGVVPIIGIDYERYTLDTDDSPSGKADIERVVGNVFSCYTSNSEGNKVESVANESGYLTFCAYPGILETRRQEVYLIVRGLGMTDASEGELYLGPQGLMFAGNGMGDRSAASNYYRALPEGGVSHYLRQDPVVDMKTTNPGDYYRNKHADSQVPLYVHGIEPITDAASVLSIYSNTDELPAAVYGTLLNANETGSKRANPLDVASPGTVKVYHDGDESDIRLLEDNRSANVGLTRHATTHVISQRDKNTALTQTYIPVSDDTTVNIAGVRSFATRYIWLSATGAGGGLPTYTWLSSIENVVVGEGVTGYVSQKFIDNYGIELQHLNDIKDVFKENGVEHVTGYFSTIPEEEWGDYVCVLMSSHRALQLPSQQLSSLIIRKRDGAVFQLRWRTHDNLKRMGAGFNITNGAEVIDAENNKYKYKDSVTNYVGWFWNGSGDGSNKDAHGNVIYTGHPTAATSIPEYFSFYQPGASMPKPPSSFSGESWDWLSWQREVTLEEFLQETGQSFDELSIHADYRGLSLNDFLIKSSVRNVTLPDDENNTGAVLPRKIDYLYRKEQCPANATDFKTLTADCTITIPGTGTNFFESRYWEFIDYPSDSQLTAEYVRADSSIMVAKSQSGHNVNQGLSLCDENGLLFQFSGTSDKLSVDVITWDSLLTALNHNKSVDVLGPVLAGLKGSLTGSGTRWLEFKNGRVADNVSGPIRLYISRTEPSDDDIPEGSIGIGW